MCLGRSYCWPLRCGVMAIMFSLAALVYMAVVSSNRPFRMMCVLLVFVWVLFLFAWSRCATNGENAPRVGNMIGIWCLSASFLRVSTAYFHVVSGPYSSAHKPNFFLEIFLFIYQTSLEISSFSSLRI